jgi:hypothetical protein
MKKIQALWSIDLELVTSLDPCLRIILEIYVAREWKDELIVWHKTPEACQR